MSTASRSRSAAAAVARSTGTAVTSMSSSASRVATAGRRRSTISTRRRAGDVRSLRTRWRGECERFAPLEVGSSGSSPLTPILLRACRSPSCPMSSSRASGSARYAPWSQPPATDRARGRVPGASPYASRDRVATTSRRRRRQLRARSGVRGGPEPATSLSLHRGGCARSGAPLDGTTCRARPGERRCSQSRAIAH